MCKLDPSDWHFISRTLSLSLTWTGHCSWNALTKHLLIFVRKMNRHKSGVAINVFTVASGLSWWCCTHHCWQAQHRKINTGNNVPKLLYAAKHRDWYDATGLISAVWACLGSVWLDLTFPISSSELDPLRAADEADRERGGNCQEMWHLFSLGAPLKGLA